MAKPALGKGLGQLMGGQRSPGKTLPSVAEKVTPVDFGRGLSTLVTPRTAENAESAPALLLPPWFFFLADLLLLAFAVVICADASEPMELGEMFFAAISVTLGALLALAGVCRATRSASKVTMS